MLARAFYDDPVSVWSLPHGGLRERALKRFFAIRLRQVARKGEVWVAGEGRSAALWLPPGGWRTTLAEELALATASLRPPLLFRLPLVAYGLLGVERSHPRTPDHWYLAVLGTEPAQQGRGYGSAALAAVLGRCDREGIPAYLESSTFDNIPFYARPGFQVRGTLRLLRGPTVYPMWREPLQNG